MVAAIIGGLTAQVGWLWSGGWRPPGAVCIHQMNRVNSCSDHGHEDSTINIVVDYYDYYYYFLLLRTKQHHDQSSRLVTTDIGRKLGAVPLRGEDGFPPNTMSPGPRL